VRTVIFAYSLIAALSLAGCGGGSTAAVPGDANGLSVPVEGPPARNGDVLRITSVNGDYEPVHPTQILVRPGDVIALTADVFAAQQGLVPRSVSVESLNWRTTFSANDVCLPSINTNCLGQSNFQLTNYGVLYYVPYSMPHQLQLIVTDPSETALNNQPIYDSIVLINSDYDGQTQPVMLTNPLAYTGTTLDPQVALTGMGHWVTLGDVRYFMPITYVTTTVPEWKPYTHGYWAWNDAYGWTWVSYDPWGWVTEHFGVWRHHGVYGWLWLPFNDVHYEPHCISWINSAQNVGWFPYHARYPLGYGQGEAMGFDDGFWLGTRVGLNFGQPGYAFHPGISMVANANVLQPNLALHLLPHLQIEGLVREEFAKHPSEAYFAAPGGMGARSPEAKQFLGRFADHVPMVNLSSPRQARSVNFHFPMPDAEHVAPAETQEFLHQLNPLKTNLAVGSVVRLQGTTPQVIASTKDNRALSPAPVIHNSKGETVGTLAPHTHSPVAATAGNPIAEHAAQSKNPIEEVPSSKMPKLDLSKAKPGPKIFRSPRQIKDNEKHEPQEEDKDHGR
jgi:hypothetical protein